MDFVELEAIEGLRWSWNTWPDTKAEAAAMVIPLSVIYTPLMQYNDLPLLNYDPLHCSTCTALLNPYSRVDYSSRSWICPFCYHTNSFPRSYAGISDTNLPAELFPTYSTVEYQISRSNSSSSLNLNSLRHRSPFSSSSSFPPFSSHSAVDSTVFWPAFVFVVDICSCDEELMALKSELLLVLAQLPEHARVGLVTFDSMVYVHDIGSSDFSRVVVFHGERQLTSQKVCRHLHIHSSRQQPSPGQGPAFLLPISCCEFGLTSVIDDIRSSGEPLPGNRARRATGAAISAGVGLLEACQVTTGSRVMVFTSGPATVGPALIVGPSLGEPIRSHPDLLSGRAVHYPHALSFYATLSHRLSHSSIVLDLFVSSLDQVGLSELRAAVDPSGGLLVLADSFASDHFRRSLRHLFRLDPQGGLATGFDITLEIVASSDVKIRGALGPCLSAGRTGRSVSGSRLGEGGTSAWKLCTATPKTAIAFFFEAAGEGRGPGSAFFLQFITRYRQGAAGVRKRVTTVARRWAGGRRAAEVAAGFDQEAAAAVVSRMAVHRAETRPARDVVRWLDRKLVGVCSRFGEYVEEDPSSFRLSSGFSLYPQLMYYLRRSHFIEVFNSSVDETALCRSALRREGVAGTTVMIQPALTRFTAEGPPVQVAPEVGSVCRDALLLFDSYFHVVIHYGAGVGRGAGEEEEELRRRMVEEAEARAEHMTADRVPPPKVIRCDQYSSEARFLLARLSPSSSSVGRGSPPFHGGSEVGLSDDLSLQVFVDHLHELAVQA